MNRILDRKYRLSIPEEKDCCFIIDKVLGKGASSVTYLAKCGKTEHVIKECNPLGLHMHRNDDGMLIPDSELNKEKFEECLNRFIEGANKQLSLRLNDKVKNTTSNITKIYNANGTAYIDMTYFEGKTYDKVVNESLYDLFRRMKALTQIIGNYHDLGYLHLDIKPQNIYTIPETPEMIMMFDFDSMTPIDDIDAIISSAYTNIWAAPEQKIQKYRKEICRATDLFAIGEIVFYRIMGRHSLSDERFSFSKYEYDKNSEFFKNVNPKIFRLLDEFFHKTLCVSHQMRYQTADELIKQIDKIIDILSSTNPYLICNTNFNALPKYSLTKSLIKTHEKLQSEGRFFNKASSKNKNVGIEKYLSAFNEDYDTIVCLNCGCGLTTMIESIPIANFTIKDSKTTFEQVLALLNQLCDNKVLLVITNFHEGCLVDDNYFDIDEIIQICKQLAILPARILIDGSFSTDNFQTYHWNYYYRILKELSEFFYENKRYDDAKLYIKKASAAAQKCGDSYNLKFECQSFLKQIKSDEWWALPTLDDDEEILNEALWENRCAVITYGQK